MNIWTLSDSFLYWSTIFLTLLLWVNFLFFNTRLSPSNIQLKTPDNSVETIFLLNSLSCLSSGIVTSKGMIKNRLKYAFVCSTSLGNSLVLKINFAYWFMIKGCPYGSRASSGSPDTNCLNIPLSNLLLISEQ